MHVILYYTLTIVLYYIKEDNDIVTITLTLRYMKNLQSVSCSAIGGVGKNVDIYIQICMIMNGLS